MSKLIDNFVDYIRETTPKTIRTVTAEYAVSVEDMIKALLGKKWNNVDDEEVYDLFDDAGLEWVEKQIKDLMRDERVNNVKIDKVSFVETDSGNWSHAGAYYSVTITGPQEEIDKIVGEDKELYAETEEETAQATSDTEQYEGWKPLIDAFFKQKGVLKGKLQSFMSNPTQADGKMTFHATVTDDPAGGGGIEKLVTVDTKTKKITAVLENKQIKEIVDISQDNNVLFRLKGDKTDRKGVVANVIHSKEEPLQTYSIESEGKTYDLRVYKSKAQNFDKLVKESKSQVKEVSFGTPFSGNNIDKKIEGEELIRAVRFVIAAEHEAAQLYMQIHDATDNESVKKIMKSITDEELVHVGEFERLLHELSPNDEDLNAQGAAEADDAIGIKQSAESEKPKTIVTGVESEPKEESNIDEQ